MLYLIRSASYKRGETILKLGYANNFERRFSQYEACNPSIEKVKTRDGDIMDETKFHLYLHSLGFREYKDEWYKDCQEVIDIFDKPIEEIESKLWENRENVFTDVSFSNETKKQHVIYSDLIEKNMDDVFSEKEINGNIIKDFVDKDVDFQYINITEIRRLEKRISEISEKDIKTNEETLFLSIISNPGFPERMKYIYELDEENKKLLDSVFDWLPFYYGNFYRTLTYEQAKAKSFRKGELEKKYDKSFNNQDIDISPLVYQEFKAGEKYTMSWIKEKLGEIYTVLGYKGVLKQMT